MIIANEYMYLDVIFEADAKNFHAWSHYVWLVERFELWNDERHMTFIEDLLDKNVRNNSVWSFRYFIMARSKSKMPSRVRVNTELRYVTGTRLPNDWRNEAAWVYLNGYLATSPKE